MENDLVLMIITNCFHKTRNLNLIDYDLVDTDYNLILTCVIYGCKITNQFKPSVI